MQSQKTPTMEGAKLAESMAHHGCHVHQLSWHDQQPDVGDSKTSDVTMTRLNKTWQKYKHRNVVFCNHLTIQRYRMPLIKITAIFSHQFLLSTVLSKHTFTLLISPVAAIKSNF